MKRPIAWHEDCIRNSRYTYSQKVRMAKETIERAQKEITEAEKVLLELDVYEKKVTEVKAKGMDNFDADRFRKSRTDETGE
jgi:hypothetical protein